MRKLATWLLAAAGVLVIGSALADLTVKDGGGVTRTLKNFVCETTKLCSATVLIKSDGTEIGTSSAEVFVGGRGTAGSAAGGVLTVQGSASGTAIPVTVSNTNANGQAAASSSSPVVVAKNSGTGSTVAGAAVGTAGSASAEVVTVQGVASMTPILSRPSDGTRNATLDACESNAHSYATGVITSATTTRIIAPSASNKTYLCAFFMKASAADNVAVIEGTGGTCGTGTAALLGGTTTANGFVFGTAGDGVLLQAGGKVAIVQTAGTNVDTCLITSTTGPLIWSAKYVQAP
jgi:hypothetical protein